MRSRPHRRLAAMLVLGALTATSACGLKAGAVANLQAAGTGTLTATGGGLPGAGGGTTTAIGSSPNLGGTATSGTGGSGLPAATSAGSAPGGSAAPGTGTGTSQAAATGPAVPCGVPSGGDTTGITKTTINIGLHAPLTGTGTPFPNSSFQKGAQVFFDQPQNKVCGRKVQVDFEDDTYTPDGANRVCSQFAKTSFLAIGGAGTDQIQACATNTDINRTGTPYLSAGVTDNGMRNLKNYFAISLTYEQQGGIVVRNALAQGFGQPPAATGGAKKQWAVVTANTPNFDGATVGISRALDQAGISYDVTRFNQNGGNYQAAAKQLGQQLALDGYKTIFVDAAPGVFVFLTQGYYNAAPTGNGVHWTGPGVTFTDFLVAQLVCQGSAGAINGAADFLAPNPGIDRATPDFKAAFNNSYDDIEWGLWGLDQAIYQMLQAANTNLTRQHFIQTVQAGTFGGGAFAPASFRGGHFGGTGAWVQRVNCSKANPNQPNDARGRGSWDTIGSTYLKP